MFRSTTISLIAVAAAGGCNNDEQAALADGNAVGEKQSVCAKSALGFSGINHDKFTSCVKDALSIGDTCSECYYATAQYGFKNCKAACLLGWCKQGCLDCTKDAQVTLAACTGFSSGDATPCLENTGAACSAAEQALLADGDAVGEKQSVCGKSALGFRGIDHDKFTGCVQDSLKIGSSCSECYYATAQYGFKNCKAACLLGWCKQGCLDCTKDAQVTLAACTGFSSGDATPCFGENAAPACSATEQAALADGNAVGEKQSVCAKSALGFRGIDHDKFTSCVKDGLSIGDTCTECYYTTAQYGFKNCKAACLLGWCKQGCLDCTADAQVDLAACTGFTGGDATPCMDMIV